MALASLIFHFFLFYSFMIITLSFTKANFSEITMPLSLDFGPQTTLTYHIDNAAMLAGGSFLNPQNPQQTSSKKQKLDLRRKLGHAAHIYLIPEKDTKANQKLQTSKTKSTTLEKALAQSLSFSLSSQLWSPHCFFRVWKT